MDERRQGVSADWQRRQKVLPATSPANMMRTENESADSQKPPGLSDPEQWVDLHDDYLFKYALARLRDPAKAEDAVQETFLAALKGGKTFQGRSAEKSWLVGILKNKVYDHFRKSS